MKIKLVDIQNYRKLKSCRVELSDSTTVFVGANSSGKTSAMNALMMFLKKQRDISTKDFTLSNWKYINEIGVNWIYMESKENNLNLSEWRKYVPTLDVWIHVEKNEVHYVSHLIPSLDWTGDLLGVRLLFEPRDLEKLYFEYKSAYKAARKIGESKNTVKLWPQSMHDFLDRELLKHFTVNAYLLDPSKIGELYPQNLPDNSEPIEGDPFKGLFKIDIKNAQRGLTDSNYTEGGTNTKKLTVQLRKYFDNHLNPLDMPDITDLDALEAIESAREAFDLRLNESFRDAIKELEELNYPGFSDPKIIITSKVNPIDGLNHDSAVQFSVSGNNTNEEFPYLPETYNGLGYQNLISMVFSLIEYRDEWMRVGKAGKHSDYNSSFIEPLHIVMIEEPEAHLHPQAQQVFIKKAYQVLRNHPNLKDNNQFSTQLIISTHSSHIAHASDFTSLRYFRRIPAKSYTDVPTSEVVNLSDTFGDNTDTSKFAIRYLKSTHCDLFFADAAILVEGPAERMLIPHFIRNHFKELDRSYISVLEIGGSHAHRLRPLIEKLGLLTLIITDIDSVEKGTNKKVIPITGKDYITNNDTMKSWVPEMSRFDDLMKVNPESKVKNNHVRVAYQTEIMLEYCGNEARIIPYTFEDALVLSNILLFKNTSSSNSLIKKMVEALNKPTVEEACKHMFKALEKTTKKAEMALELLFIMDPCELKPPHYIVEGLIWLQEKLKQKQKDYIITGDV